jgi:hypothetical protein
VRTRWLSASRPYTWADPEALLTGCPLSSGDRSLSDAVPLAPATLNHAITIRLRWWIALKPVLGNGRGMG